MAGEGLSRSMSERKDSWATAMVYIPMILPVMMAERKKMRNSDDIPVVIYWVIEEVV